MHFPVLLASVAALALAACGSNNNSGSSGEQAESTTSPAAKQMRQALQSAPRHGLTPDLFYEGDLEAAPEGKLREAVMNYASALANGKVDPTKVREVYTVPRPKVDVKAGFDQALQQDQLGQWLDSLAPQNPEYKALSNAFVQLVEAVPNLESAPIPTGKGIVKQGDSDPRVPAIAQNLRAQGYLAAAAPQPAGGQQAPNKVQQGQERQQQQSGESQQAGNQAQTPQVYTAEMSKALAQWQADAGLKPDGVVGPNTVEALNAGPKDRARKLAVAMERLRWLEREPPSTRIDVNTAASFLEYFRDGQKIDQRVVVVGEPGWETPQLASPIFALVANPDWVVPESIVEEEIEGKSSAWLRANNFSQKSGRWVQEPGPESALGLVKFAMQNDESIYLHDTPHKAIFEQDNRHRSHGCVRVENAVQFAQVIARQSGIADKFSQAMQKDEETQVEMPTKIPVRLLYHTAYLAGNGRVQYAEDVYGWDNDVATALGYETRQSPKVQHRSGVDVGP